MVKKKLLSLLIAAVMVLAMVPATAWADGGTQTTVNEGSIQISVRTIEYKTENTTVVVLTSEDYLSYLNDTDSDKDLMDYVTELKSNTSGTLTAQDYKGIKNGSKWNTDNAFILFFAKPDDGYALTTFGKESGIVDPISDLISHNTNYTIKYTYQEDIGNALANEGYVAVFGFSNRPKDLAPVSAFSFTAVSEKLVDVTKTITAVNGETVSDPENVEVYEDDVITYQIIVTRIKESVYSDKALEYKSITLSDKIGETIIINNDDLSNVQWETDSGDNDKESYTCDGFIYTHTVDANDVTEGEIKNIATVDYSYYIYLAGTSASEYTGKVSVDTTCTAYVLGTYTVTFDSNGGSSVASQTVKEGNTATEPDDPTLKGYTFVGWYYDEDFDIECDFTEPISEDTILYAKWKKNKSNNGGGSSYSLDEVDTSDDDDEDEEDYDSDIKLNTEEHFQYISGYPDGTVRPTANITRAEVATIFYRLLDDNTRNAYYSTYTTFDDVDSNQWYLKAIATLTNAGILHGDSDSNTFRPDDNITRAEFATIVSFFDEIVYTNEDAFSDISGHWANVYINSAYAKGWVAGYNGYFNPDTAITRAEAMTLINNVLGREVDEDGLHEDAKQWPDNLEFAWYYYEVLEATNYHEYVIDDDEAEVWTDILPNKVWNEGAA